MKNVFLQIKRKELDLIKSGTKKTEWRSPSLFNKKILFSPDPEFAGKLNGNPEITSITFINGMQKNAERVTVEVVERIRMVKFSQDIKIESDNFEAFKDQFAIEIKLGKIISNS